MPFIGVQPSRGLVGTAGKGNKDGEWYKAVAKVKSDISKPG
jgi:hypothetical protein